MTNHFEIIDLFFSLVRNALWHSEEHLPKELSGKQAGSILNVAEYQAVQGLIIDALVRNDVRMPKQNVFEAFSVLEKTKETNRILNKGIRELAEIMRTNAHDFLVFKGQTAAVLYPDPLLRMSGDIDFLTYDYARARQIIENEWRICLPKSLIEKETSFDYKGVTYEVHTHIVEFRCRNHQRYWDSIMQRSHQSIVLIDEKEIKTLSPNIYAVYVFAHLFFHFIREGVGLRQMCDWAVILDRYKNEIDTSQLSKNLDGLGMTKAYCAFGGVLTKHLGLKSFPLPLHDRDLVVSERILKDILHYGNFGKPSRKVHRSGWKFKMETMTRTIRNCWKYFWLAPSEVGMIIPKLITLNIKLLLHKD